MKIKREKLVILLILGLIFPILINNNINFSDKQTTITKNPKSSGGYNPTFIHIDGSILNNWSDTETNYAWCNFENGYYVIENVTINADNSPTGSGILINNSRNVDFIIRNCTLFNADGSYFDSGIWLENTSKGIILNNTCSDNHLGIYLIDCDVNNITENIVYNNENNGIYLVTDCDNNTITGNTVNENNNFGIALTRFCDNNNITLNTANKNDESGIYINSAFGDSCNNNIILNNTANENYQHGIYIRSDNYDNSIINNTANDNIYTGVNLVNSNDINVTGNTINNNKLGIDVESSDNSNIMNNTINSNLEIGINLESSDSNKIKNNTINRSDLGIRLDDSDYNNITGNTLLDNSWCIYETDCEGNIIEYNDCSTPTVELPIYIDDYATGVGAHNWTWANSQTWCSGSGTNADPYIIQNLRISGYGIYDLNGIEILNSNDSFIIQGCAIYNSVAGISLKNVNNSQLIDNNCSNNLDYGIFLENDCYYNIITENTCNDNGAGIYLNNDCNSTIISRNTLNYNDYGIVLSYCGHNNITGNTVTGNINYGIRLESFCDYNIIRGNNFDRNGLGIEIYEESDFNIVVGNSVDNNTYGIYLQDNSYNNTILGNTIKNCEEQGILLEDSCDDNEFTDNVIYNNNLGIEVANGNDNLFHKNFFLKNGKHAVDDGTDNTWNATTIGNYWDNWTSPDTNNDGIVDDPYTYIGGSAGSIDYLPIAEDGAPQITINSPSEGDAFSTTAPNFSVTITDVYVYTRWYTVNGGLQNYTFSENGMINQSAWDALANGATTLIFYASDIVGNIASEEVSIIKDTIAPVIIINAPTEGETFGKNAPLFNITVTDDNLEVMWYSFDGGTHVYIITNNSIFNQSAWTTLSQGDVTITFYARDIAGNEVSESVTVIKSVPSGLDPGVIITIVIVSIIGGVAVISVVYIFMKKRTTP